MILLRRSIHIAISILMFTSSALADISQELQTVLLEGNIYGHSTEDVSADNKRNIASVIPKGSTGTVLEAYELKKKNTYRVKVRISSVGKNMGRTTAKVDDEVWVYYSKSEPWLKFKNKDNQTVTEPEKEARFQAKRDGEGLPAVKPVKPEQEKPQDPNLAMSKDKRKTEGDFQTNCNTCMSSESAAKKNIKDIDELQKKIRTKKSSTKVKEDPWADDPFIASYSNSKTVAKAIEIGRKRTALGDTGHCYKFVKDALLAGKVIKSRPEGKHAKNGVSDLENQGMVNLLDNPKYAEKIKSPEDVPKGAIIVYDLPSQPGHIEIKADYGANSTYISNYESRNNIQNTTKGLLMSRLGKPYKMIGVMILPPGET